MISRFALLASLSLLTLEASLAVGAEKLPEWERKEESKVKLGKVFSDKQIRFQPPFSLRRVNQPATPEFAKRGVYMYAWSPDGIIPSIENISVTLTPFAKPSSEALDKTIDGMKASIVEQLDKVAFPKSKKGIFRGFEARSGKYSTIIEDQTVLAFYLVGIDNTGSFAISAMIPQSKATPKKLQELRESMLSFDRSLAKGKNSKTAANK